MPERYLPGVPCWIAHGDPAAAPFYAELFGWAVEEGVARLGGRAVAGFAAGPPGWTTHVRVEDARAAAERAVAAGGRADGALVTDPQGATFAVAETGGAELVNASGTWNWSNLETGDPDGAQAFYAAVFGWEPMPMGPGVAMWRVPGYGDRLAELDPSLRERHAEAGIPAGFSDAVAWLVPGEVARWTVTFAADDPDGIAARAEQLGGTVLVAPYDEQGARIATLRDPSGAEFTVSHWSG